MPRYKVKHVIEALQEANKHTPIEEYHFVQLESVDLKDYEQAARQGVKAAKACGRDTDQNIQRLIGEIKDRGLNKPPVLLVDDEFRVVEGNHRVIALLAAGHRLHPCIVLYKND